MTAIVSELDRLLEEADFRQKEAARRTALSRGAFRAHRAKALEDFGSLHPLKAHRLSFRGEGLSLEALSERSTVGVSTIRELEGGAVGSDASWNRLARALNVRRPAIDRRHLT